MNVPATLREQFDAFIESLRYTGKSKQSLRSYETTYRLYIRDGYDFIDDTTVEKFLQKYDNPATRNKVIGHITSFASWMRRKYPTSKIQTLGSLTIRQAKLKIQLPIVVDDPDAKKFMDALERLSPLAHAHAALIRNTGMRFSEVYELRAGNYWEPEPGMSAIKFTGKGGRERLVLLNPAAKAAFDVWVGARRLLSDAKFPHPNTIRYAYRRAEKEAGVRVKPHWFRHGVATKLRANGAAYDDIADLLGNSVEVCRQRYARMDHKSLSRLVSAL